MKVVLFAFALLLLAPAAHALAQTPPEIAYVYPPGGAPGTTVDVLLGGFNWTPDMQLFVHDPRVTLQLAGPPGPVIVPYPPYWFGRKARDSDPPLPREFPAKLTIAAGTPPGLVRWQVANANGAAASGVLLVATEPEIRESAKHKLPQALPTLPVAVSGQLSRLEEIDRYTFTAARTGPITLDVWTRRLKTKMNPILEVRDPSGRLVADAADTAGNDLQLTFAAQQGVMYSVSLYDVDFRGYTAYVYRLVIHDGPQVVAAIPSAGKRGETRPVEFIGYGVATGAPQLESMTQNVTFPADPAIQSVLFQITTPHGKGLPYSLALSDRVETIEPPPGAAAARKLALPASLTGILEQKFGEDRFTLDGKKGETWQITARSACSGAPLDLSLALFGPDGKEVARADNMTNAIDTTLLFAVPADGAYQLAVTDVSGQSGTRGAAYHLTVEIPLPDFTITIPEMLAVPLGGKIPLPVKVTRKGGFAEPIVLQLAGLPAGITLPADLTIAKDKSDLALELTCAADASVVAGVVSVRGTSTVGGQPAMRAAGDILVAITMKPRAKLVPEGLDDVRKWPRGSTFPSPVFVERLEGFAGPVVLEQTAYQQRSRQGMTGPEVTVPPGVGKVDYPIYVPEWMETTKTSRFILNAVVQVPDPKGKVRYLLNKMELRLGILPVGAMLRLSHGAGELHVAPKEAFNVPLVLTRTAELTGDVVIELKLSEEITGQLTAAPLTIPAKETEATLHITPAATATLRGEHELTIRATVLHQGKLPTISETTVIVMFDE